MLFVYGPYMTVRLLEEICFWKMQEKEHTVVIREIAPNLEPLYVEMLKEWEPVFEHTEQVARRLLLAALAAPHAVPPAIAGGTDALLQVAARQSRTFVEQLNSLIQVSPAVAGSPIAVTVVRHIIRESDYFLCVLATLLQPRTGSEQARSSFDAASGWSEASGRTDAGGDGGLGTDAAEVRASSENADGSTRADGGSGTDSAYGRVSRINADGSTRADSSSGTDSADDRASSVNADGSTRADAADADRAPAASVPIGGHTLPPLPYPYEALEPFIDQATMRIHHDKHHQSYVDGLNKAEKELEKARQSGDFSLVKHWERELAFNGAGHYLHTLFWSVMTPRGGGPALGALAQQIRKDFGSFDAFKKQFSEAAEKVEGGGWAILVWSPRSRRLELLTAEKHQNLSQWDVVPILPLDVWEHAYYLKHQNKRADYIKDWWSVVNWPYANERFAEASRLVWQPF